MLSLILILPLLSFCTVLSGGFFYWFHKYNISNSIFFVPLGRMGAVVLTCFCMFINALISILLFVNALSQNNSGQVIDFSFFDITALNDALALVFTASWIHCFNFNISWGFLFDNLTFVMLVVVNIVSFLVHIYSVMYMWGDPALPRFMSYLSLFTFFMLILVTSSNLIQMFVGWEGVGICSYLLINFWSTRIQANKAALKAMVVNKFGDIALMLSIAVSFYFFKTVEFTTLFKMTPFFVNESINLLGYNLFVLDFFCLLLFIAAVGKSAQLGLHMWLPDAMEGPTPVSALIHAATMVTAGVFLIVRCSPIFEYAPNILALVVFIGALTAFFAGTIGLVQHDLKKVIAYSTCSQIGYMFFTCGLSCYGLSMFHLLTHAFFKALLFLSAGSVIHALMGEQDIRRMGGLVNVLPFTYTMMLIGSLALAGAPFLAGFYSKDIILETAFGTYDSGFAKFASLLGLFAAFLTAAYSYRLLYFVFLAKPNHNRLPFYEEADLVLGTPLIILVVGSIFSGYLLKDVFIGLGSNFFYDSILTLPQNLKYVNSEFVPASIKVLPTVFSVSGVLFMIFFTQLSFTAVSIKLSVNNLYRFLVNKWYFDKVFGFGFSNSIMLFANNVCYKIWDTFFLIFGAEGCVNFYFELRNKTSAVNFYRFNLSTYLQVFLLGWGLLFFTVFFI